LMTPASYIVDLKMLEISLRPTSRDEKGRTLIIKMAAGGTECCKSLFPSSNSKTGAFENGTCAYQVGLICD